MNGPGPQVGNLEMEGYHKDTVPPQGARGPNRIMGPPSSGALHWEGGLPGSGAFKTSEAYIQENWWAIGSRASSIKGHT